MELFSFYLKLKNIFYYLFSRQKIENKWYSHEFFSFHSLPSIIYLRSSPNVFLTSFPSPIRHAFFPSLPTFPYMFSPFYFPYFLYAFFSSLPIFPQAHSFLYFLLLARIPNPSCNHPITSHFPQCIFPLTFLLPYCIFPLTFIFP